MLSRRDFIKMIGAFGAIVFTPLNRWIKKAPAEGELYEGFVILENTDSAIPLFVETAPCPILCQEVEDEDFDPELSRYRGETIWFNDIDELRKNTYFPLFIPNLLPEGMEILQGYILRFAESKEIWEARVDFGFKDDAEPLISTSARPIFSKPYPIWPVVTYPEKDPEEIILDDEFIVKMPEKVGFTPEYGVMIYSDRGYTLQWIGNEILYTLFMEYEKLRNDVESVGNSLVEI